MMTIQLIEVANERITSDDVSMVGGVIWCSSKVLFTTLPPMLTRLLTAVLVRDGDGGGDEYRKIHPWQHRSPVPYI